MGGLPWYVDLFVVLFFIGTVYILFYPAFSSMNKAGETSRKRFDKQFRKRFPELFENEEDKDV